MNIKQKVLSLRLGSLYRNAGFIVSNNFIVSLFGFVFWITMAHQFTAYDVGIGSALVATVGFLANLSNLGLGIGLMRFLPCEKENANDLINGAFFLSGIVNIIGASIYIASIEYWSPNLNFITDSPWMIVVFLGCSIITLFSILTDNSLIGGRSAQYVVLKNVISSVAKIPIPVFIFPFLNGVGIFVGTGIAIFFGCVYAWVFFLPKVFLGFYPRFPSSFKFILGIMPYSFGNYLVNLFNVSMQYIYPIMVLNRIGAEYSGYFWIAWTITMVLGIVPVGVGQSLLSEGAYDIDRFKENVKKALAFSLLLGVFGVVILNLLSERLLSCFGEQYATHGVNVIRYLSFGILPQCINVTFMTVNQVKRRLGFVVVQAMFTASIALIGGWYFLGLYGLVGIAKAYTMAQLIVSICVFVPLCKEMSRL